MILLKLPVTKAFSRATILLTYSFFTFGSILDNIKSLYANLLSKYSFKTLLISLFSNRFSNIFFVTLGSAVISLRLEILVKQADSIFSRRYLAMNPLKAGKKFLIGCGFSDFDLLTGFLFRDFFEVFPLVFFEVFPLAFLTFG